MTEADIIHECGPYTVRKDRAHHAWTVYKDGFTVATSVQSFAATDDGKSCAIAYANYLGRKSNGTR